MKKPILLFLLILVLVFFEGLARTYYFTQTDIIKKFNTFRDTYSDSEVLIIGACPLAYGINPQLISKKTYNFAYIDENLYYSLAYFKKLLAREQEIKTVIVELDPIIFFANDIFDRGEADELAHQKMLIRDSLRDLKIAPNTNLNIFKSLTYQSNFLLFREVLFKKVLSCVFFKQDCKTVTTEFQEHNGFMPKDNSFFSEKRFDTESKKNLVEIETIDYIKNLIFFKYGFENRKILQEIASLSKEKNIQVLFVSPPFYSEFNKFFEKHLPQEMKDLFTQTIQELKKSFDNVHYIDSRNFFAHNPEESKYFFDVIHVNKEGAKIYTEYLDTELRKIRP